MGSQITPNMPTDLRRKMQVVFQDPPAWFQSAPTVRTHRRQPSSDGGVQPMPSTRISGRLSMLACPQGTRKKDPHGSSAAHNATHRNSPGR